jgi:FkbM family methyltransferase
MDQHDYKNMVLLDRIKCISRGDVLVDVGACRGTYTRFFANRLMHTGKLYCLELSPINFKRLQKDFSNHKNIEFVNAAISDLDGSLPYYEGHTSETHNILGHDTGFLKNQEAGTIQSITLDTLLKDEKYIKMIKIDVEGAEGRVLKGMKEVAKRTEYLLLENHFDEDWEEIREILIEEYDFTCYNIETDALIDMTSKRPYQCLCTRKK